MNFNDKQRGRKEIHLSLSPRDGVVYDFFENLYAPSKSAVIKKMVSYCIETGALASLLAEERDLETNKVIRPKLGILSKEFGSKYSNYFERDDMITLFGEVLTPSVTKSDATKEFKNHATQVYKQAAIEQPKSVNTERKTEQPVEPKTLENRPEPTRINPSIATFVGNEDNKGDRTVVSVNKPANGSSGYDY